MLKMKIKVYDADDRSNLNDLNKQEFIGEAEFYMHELIRAKDQNFKQQLTDKGKNTGIVILKVEEIKERLSNNIAVLTIECQGVKVSSNLFYCLLRSDSSSFLPVYQSEAIKAQEGVVRWHNVRIYTASLFRDDESKLIQIALYEYSSSGKHKLMDTQTFTFTDILDNYKWKSTIGTIVFKNTTLEKRISFLEYLFGGCQISLTIAIDFTGSNGSPDTPNSLHFINPATNQYMKVIRAIGSIMQEYDSDKNIPLLGFGAGLPGHTNTSHCFALNGNIFAPEVYTIDGVLSVYQKNLTKLRFSGPTNFAGVIRYVGDNALWYVNNGLMNHYFVLLIMTDGLISDLQETINEIVRCSELPMSIIIVGVGNENFKEMDKLDADKNPLYSTKFKKYAVRDIVQFVPFNKFAHTPEELSRQTLAELPNQLVEYMTTMKVPPLALPNTHAGPDFYTSKKMAFINSFAAYGQAANAEKLLECGFPVEDIQEFSKALLSGYTNLLHY
jgi:hypothetical protein